jgi:hypothetical protein
MSLRDFGSGPQTRKVRNLSENPHVAVHPESDDVVILEGVAEMITDPDPRLAERVYTASGLNTGWVPTTSRAPTLCVHASSSPGPGVASRTPRRVGSWRTTESHPKAPLVKLPLQRATGPVAEVVALVRGMQPEA